MHITQQDNNISMNRVGTKNLTYQDGSREDTGNTTSAGSKHSMAASRYNMAQENNHLELASSSRSQGNS